MTSRPLPWDRGSFDRTQNHWWWREGWGPGTRYVTWHPTFAGAATLHEAARRSGEALCDLTPVDLVHIEWLHLTMTGVAFAGDVNSSALGALADAVLQAATSQHITPVVFDRVFLYREGLSLRTATPWRQHLRARQLDMVSDAGEVAPARDETFCPHVSLMYSSGEVNEKAMEIAIRRARLSEVVVPAPRLSLIDSAATTASAPGACSRSRPSPLIRLRDEEEATAPSRRWCSR